MPPGTQRSRLVVSLSRELSFAFGLRQDSKDVLKLSRGTGKFFFTTTAALPFHYVTLRRDINADSAGRP